MAADHYAVLGVSHQATASEIRSAYYKVVKKSHPDVTQDPKTVQHFQLATKAFKVLSDPIERERYDWGYQPIASVQDLFARHPAGKNVMEIMMPSAPAVPQRGVDTVLVVQGKLVEDGVTITLPDGENGERELFVQLPEQVDKRAWCRLRQLGGVGRNQADNGDLWIVLASLAAKDR